MKNILLILTILLFVIACKSRKVELKKSVEEVKKELVLKHDSAISVITETIILNSHNSRDFFKAVESVPDSSGAFQPLYFKHTKNGQVIEEISLSGGKLTAKEEQKSEESKSNIENKENINFAGNKDVKQDDYSKNIDKNKESKTTGFQFGFWAFALIIVFLIVIIIAFKDRLKGLLKYFK